MSMTNVRKRKIWLSLLLSGIASCGSLLSQTQTAAGTAVVVPVLKGLVFVANSSDLQAGGVNSTGVHMNGLPILDQEFQAWATERLGKPLTFDGLNEITHEVVAYHRKRNHPLVDAVAPAQNVQSGVVQIVVTEFRVGEVRTEGNRWFSDEIVRAPFAWQHGDTVDGKRLINQLDAANTNPFRRVNLLYQPSQENGHTDLVLQTQDRLPLRILTGFDNGGTPVTGRSRWDFGITWGNALWRDEQLSYQMSVSPNFFGGRTSGATFMSHALTWSMPVFGRDAISISGGYQRALPDLGSSFGLVGRSGQASIRFSHALKRTGSLIQTIETGYDFKTTNNNLAFGGAQVSRTNVEIDQFPVTYAASMTDKWGSTALTMSLVYSPGSITPNNTAAAFQPALGQTGRALAAAHYVYWRADATRLTKAPWGATWATRVLGQASNANLLYTEQLAAGGPDILRGYDPASILGDRGIIISNELRTPTFRSGGEAMKLLGAIQALGFWDWGHLTAVHPYPGVVNQVSASSAGTGLRYSVRSNLTARADWGWRLQHLPTDGPRQQLLLFSLIASY